MRSPASSTSAAKPGAPEPSIDEAAFEQMPLRLGHRVHLEAGDERVDDTVVGIDDRHPAPLVEGRARVRDAEHDAVADRQAGVAVEAQVGVLVVQPGDLPVGRRGAALRGRRARACAIGIGSSMSYERSRRPTARIASPGSGSDCTSAQTSSAACRPSLAAQAQVRHRDHAAIEAVVVRDVAARTQQPDAPDATATGRSAGTTRSKIAEPPADTITSSASNSCSRSHCSAISVDALHQRVGVGAVDLAVALRAQAFVALDAGEAQRRARAGATRERERLVVACGNRCGRRARRSRAAPRTAAAGCVRPRSARAAPANRAGTARAGPACSACSASMAARSPASNDLVGDQAAARAGLDADAQLRDRREGQPPRAGVELAAEQLRRHRRLAVRREAHARRRRHNAASSRGCAAARRA